MKTLLKYLCHIVYVVAISTNERYINSLAFITKRRRLNQHSSGPNDIQSYNQAARRLSCIFYKKKCEDRME